MEINISPVGSQTWGHNLLCSHWLYPGDDISIDYIDCDYYDVRIVDGTYLECVVYDVDFCFSDDYWDITDAFLDGCAFD